MTRKNTLEQRIKALLTMGEATGSLGHRSARGLLAGALVLMTGLAAVHPGTSEVGLFGIAFPTAAAATMNQAQDVQKTVAPAAVAQRRRNPPSQRPEESLPKTYTHPITVSGRALDPAGKPISGAHVYLASLRADYKRIAETTTDAEGRYELP